MKKHLSLLMLVAALLVPWASRAQETVTIGTGTSTSYYIPFNSLYGYSFTEEVYPASAINVAGSITKVRFHLGQSNTAAQTNSITLYMKNVTRSSFSSTTDIEPVTAGDIVYSGSWTIPANYTGWVEIELDNPFDYDGTSNLMVAMHEYTSGYSSRYFSYTSATNSGLSYYSDSSNPDPYNLGSYSGSKYLRSYLANMQIEITQGNISCYGVRNLTASNITAEGMTLSWLDTSNTGATYTVYRVTATDTLVVQSGITDTFYAVTNLEGNTAYTFGVKADCGSGDESSMRYVNARTACVAISSLPFSYGFEDAATGTAAEFPACWHRINDATSTYNYYPYVNNSTSYVHTGVNGLYWYHTTTSTYANNEYAILPPVDLDVYSMSNLTLAFWAKTTSTSYHPQPIIGVMTDPTDATTFTAVDTFSATAITTAWQLFAVSLEDYAGTGNYIAIKWPRPSSTSYMAIDDIYLTDDWCDIPGSVTAHSTAETVTLTWNANGGTSFTAFLGGDTVTNITDTFYTFSNLTPDSVYTYGVANECSSAISAFIEGSIRTQCLAISTFPWMQDFDAITSINDLNCWERFSGLYNDSASFTLTPTTSGWIMYSDHGMAGSQHMKVNVYSTSCQYWLMSPVFEISSGMELSFDYSLTTYASDNPIDADVTDDRFVVFAVTSDNTFVPLGKWGNDTTRDDYSYENIPNVATGFSTSLDQFTGENVRFAFYGESTVSGDDNDLHIDNVYVGAAATCPRTTSVWVSSVNPNGATINWEDTAHVGSYVVEYMPQGSTGTPLTETVTDTTVTLTGLTPNTTYEVNVRVNCGDLSLPRTVFFRTLCSYLDSLPYFENFDGVAGATSTSVAVNNLPPCWSNYNVGTSTSYSGYPIVYNSSTYAHSGAQAMRFYTYITAGTYADQYGIMPMTDSTEYPINALKVNFWMRANSTSYNSWVVVGVMTNPSDASTFVPVQTIYTNSSTTYANHNVNFGSYTGAHGCVAFKFPQPTSGYNYGYVDDVTLEVAPTCAPVVSHNVTATASAARITWDYDHDFAHGADSYEVSYGYASDNLVGATTVTVTDPIVVLTALDADTTYKVSIQPICTDGTASAHVFNFNTAALPCAEWDTTGYGGPTDTLVVGTPGTSTTNVMPVNTAENYSYCQHLILASHIAVTGPTTFSGIAFDYAASTPMTHANNCQIYMGNTTRSTFTVSAPADSAFVPYSQLTLVYNGPLNCTASGYNYFNFNQGAFAYDGTSNIVVAIVNNSGASNSSAIFRYETTSGAAMTHRVANSTTPYGPAQMDAARANQSYWRTNMKLLTGGGECISMASCYAPAVTAQQDSVGDLEVNWLPGYQETSWDLDYKAEGDSAWTNVFTGTTLTSYTFALSSLQPNTHYTFRVTPNCTDTVIAGTASFTTPCGLFPVPFTEDFDTWSSTAADPLPSCWDKHTNYSSNYPYASTSYHHSGTKAMYMYSTSTTYSYMVLPQFDLPIDSTVVSFWLYKTNTSYAHALKVGVMTDPDNYTSFTEVATVTPTALSTWEPFEVSLASYTGTGRYIAIMSPDGVYSYPYLDDLMVDRLSSCPRVENVAVDNIMQTTATVSWDSTSATDYLVEYGPAGFTPGAGTVVNVSNADSVDLTGLTAGTAYDVYVRALCTSDTSAWSYVVTFFTACDVITTLPYVEDFESYGSGSTQGINPCWTKGTNSGTAYPYPYSSNAISGQRSLYFYGYHPSSTSTTAIYSYAALPQFQEPISNLIMDFKVRTYSTSANYYTTYLLVGVMTNPNDINTFTAIDTVDLFGAGTSSIHDVSVSFANYTGSGLHIAIYDPVSPLFGSATYNYSYAYVDDIVVDVLPTCPRVNDLMATTVLLDSAVISWTDTSSNASWKVEYDTVAFTPGTGHMTPIVVTDTFCVLTGLDSGTVYHVYVYPDCGTDVFSRHTTFTTLAASPATVPYSCNFEAAGFNGWDLLNGTQGNYWIVGSATNNGGNRSMYITDDGSSLSYSGAASYVFATRTFNLGVGGYVCSYDWKCHGESTFDFLRVALVPSATQLTPGDYSGFDNTSAVPAGGIALDGGARLNLQDNWITQVEEFSITTPGTYTLVFMWRNDPSVYNMPPAAIDNVTLIANTCPMVDNLRAASAGVTSITVDWTDVATASEWQLRYGENGSTATTTMIVNSHPVTISGLDSMTSYNFIVRPICSATDTGSWCPTALLSTEYCDGAMLASTGAPTTTSYYVPLNNYYKYTLTETIIDSAELVGLGEISTIAYSYAYATAMTAKTNVTIWLQPTNKTVFSSSSDLIVLDTTIAVQVYSGSLNCQEGWNYFEFDNPYTWNGQGNLVVIVDDNSNLYNSSSYVFNASACSGYKSLYWYSDTYDADPTSATYSGTKSYVQYRPTMKLISCGGCPAPPVTVSAVTYESATITASSVGESFELEYGIGALDNTMTSTTGAFNLTGLSPATQYVYRVRQNCGDNEMSNWTEGTFTTDSLPCMAVTNLEVTELGYTSLSMSWTAVGDETAWEVNVFSTIEDTTVLVETESATVGGLVSERLYNITVRPMCGSNHNIEGPWSDTIQATTAACMPVTGLTVTPGATMATVAWTAPAGATSFRVIYGAPDFGVGDEMGTYNTNDNTFVLTDLEAMTPYTVRVANACTETLLSQWTSEDFETTNVGINGAELDGALSLFPNPASTTVTLRVSEMMVGSTVSIVDVNGRVVMSEVLNNQTLTVDLSNMSQGAYFVRITGEQNTVVRKLIVK